MHQKDYDLSAGEIADFKIDSAREDLEILSPPSMK